MSFHLFIPEQKPKARLPDGKTNPEYRRAYRKTESGKESTKRYLQSDKGKAAICKYRNSKKGKTAIYKYRTSRKGKMTAFLWREKHENKSIIEPSEYIDRISDHASANVNFDSSMSDLFDSRGIVKSMHPITKMNRDGNHNDPCWIQEFAIEVKKYKLKPKPYRR